MNANLSLLLNWAQYHEIDLDKASLDLEGRHYSFESKETHYDLGITFDHGKESREQYQAVKRAIGNFPQEEVAGDTRAELSKIVEHKGKRIKVHWDGAFECEVSYRCQFKGFKD